MEKQRSQVTSLRPIRREVRENQIVRELANTMRKRVRVENVLEMHLICEKRLRENGNRLESMKYKRKFYPSCDQDVGKSAQAKEDRKETQSVRIRF